MEMMVQAEFMYSTIIGWMDSDMLCVHITLTD